MVEIDESSDENTNDGMLTNDAGNLDTSISAGISVLIKGFSADMHRKVRAKEQLVDRCTEVTLQRTQKSVGKIWEEEMANRY